MQKIKKKSKKENERPLLGGGGLLVWGRGQVQLSPRLNGLLTAMIDHQVCTWILDLSENLAKKGAGQSAMGTRPKRTAGSARGWPLNKKGTNKRDSPFIKSNKYIYPF